jgi:uracil-DNA glycosylase
MLNIKNFLHSDWNVLLSKEIHKLYFKNLIRFLNEEDKKGTIIYPDFKNIFQCFNKTPFSKVKVIIIGQDPYHGAAQANGLSFSVNKNTKVPPSLKNIFKELESDLNIKASENGDLEKWAEQGVLLLNTVLTVEKSKAHSHRRKGWEQFTDKVIQLLNEEKSNLVFILWGAPAQKKDKDIDAKKHLIIKAPHPSPLSSYRGFFGSKPFSQTNSYLKKKKITIVDWSL